MHLSDKYLFAFYQLVKIGGWEFVMDRKLKMVLFKPNKLFDCETEMWIFSESKLRLNTNMTYKIEGILSVYDLEVLTSCGFKEAKNEK